MVNGRFFPALMIGCILATTALMTAIGMNRAGVAEEPAATPTKNITPPAPTPTVIEDEPIDEWLEVMNDREPVEPQILDPAHPAPQEFGIDQVLFARATSAVAGDPSSPYATAFLVYFADQLEVTVTVGSEVEVPTADGKSRAARVNGIYPDRVEFELNGELARVGIGSPDNASALAKAEEIEKELRKVSEREQAMLQMKKQMAELQAMRKQQEITKAQVEKLEEVARAQGIDPEVLKKKLEESIKTYTSNLGDDATVRVIRIEDLQEESQLPGPDEHRRSGNWNTPKKHAHK